MSSPCLEGREGERGADDYRRVREQELKSKVREERQRGRLDRLEKLVEAQHEKLDRLEDLVYRVMHRDRVGEPPRRSETEATLSNPEEMDDSCSQTQKQNIPKFYPIPNT